MKALHILPLEIYEFNCPLKLLQKAQKDIKGVKWVQNQANWVTSTSLNYREEFKDLHIWFQTCLDKVVDRIGYNGRCKLTQSWGNRAVENQWHHGHNHPCSYISGVIYLTTCVAETWFSIKNSWKVDAFYCKSNEDSVGIDQLIVHKIPSVAGKMIVFPSSLYHSVGSAETPETNPRYTIAWNAFPDGEIGKFSSCANIKIEPITEESEKRRWPQRLAAGISFNY